MQELMQLKGSKWGLVILSPYSKTSLLGALNCVVALDGPGDGGLDGCTTLFR
jgi:hypothetical protein